MTETNTERQRQRHSIKEVEWQTRTCKHAKTVAKSLCRRHTHLRHERAAVFGAVFLQAAAVCFLHLGFKGGHLLPQTWTGNPPNTSPTPIPTQQV